MLAGGATATAVGVARVRRRRGGNGVRRGACSTAARRQRPLVARRAFPSHGRRTRHYAWNAAFPPTTVRTILMSLIFAGSTVCGSSASTTKSASLPGVIEPLIAFLVRRVGAVERVDPQRLVHA